MERTGWRDGSSSSCESTKPTELSLLFRKCRTPEKRTKSSRVTDWAVSGLWGQQRPQGRRCDAENNHQSPGEWWQPLGGILASSSWLWPPRCRSTEAIIQDWMQQRTTPRFLPQTSRWSRSSAMCAKGAFLHQPAHFPHPPSVTRAVMGQQEDPQLGKHWTCLAESQHNHLDSDRAWEGQLRALSHPFCRAQLDSLCWGEKQSFIFRNLLQNELFVSIFLIFLAEKEYPKREKASPPAL